MLESNCILVLNPFMFVIFDIELGMISLSNKLGTIFLVYI